MGRSAPGLESCAPWLALLVAFSPVFVDLAHNLAAHPEDRVTPLAPLLLVLAIRESVAGRAAARLDGVVAISLGVALEMLGIFAQSWTIARVGLPIAALGLARWRGQPPIEVTALLFFAIPPPDSAAFLLSPGLETALARAVDAILPAVGLPVEAIGFSLVVPAGRIDLGPEDGGATLAFAFAALGWYSAARLGAGIGCAALRAALSALLAIPLQLLVLLVVGVMLGAGLPDTGQLWLDQGSWIVASALGLAWLHRSLICAQGRRDDEGSR